MSGAPDYSFVVGCAFPGPYHGHPSCNATGIRSNSVPRTMPPGHNYVSIRSHAELIVERRDGFWS